MQRRSLRVLGRKIDQMIFIPMMSGKERSKRTLREVIKMDLLINNIPESLIWDKKQ